MTQRRSHQIGTGLFILLGFTALGYLATQTTSLANYRQGPTYALKARFTNIGQLKLRAPVKVAGVRIGSVTDIQLEPDRLEALVTLAVDKRFDQLPDDSAASVFTSGLLGDQYVALKPGGSPDMFKDGDEIILGTARRTDRQIPRRQWRQSRQEARRRQACRHRARNT
jgi:phospholipid/cholesterol/gamma-HCH transport system substrate-binding protein